MPYYSEDEIAEARKMDLLTYLQTYEPQELVHERGDTYSTRTHDSLKISNGVWCWWSRGRVGGRSALDYLVMVRGLDFTEAVGRLIGASVSSSFPARPKPPPKPFTLPERHSDNRRVFAYLCSRGIDPEIINHCIKHKKLYEDKEHHNAVFVGYDGDTAKYATLRSTMSDSTFMRDVDGSDKQFSFSLNGYSASALVVTECAIDLISYLSLIKLGGYDWRAFNALSLGGVYLPKTLDEKSPPPMALEQYLKDHPFIRRIALCLDSDAVGRMAAQNIIGALPELEVTYRSPKTGKDFNDALREIKGLQNKIKTRGGNAR